jgi:hypothetical protein
MRTDFGFGYAGLILEKIFFRVLSRLGCLGANSQELAAKTKKPIRCMLGACSGQHPMGYRFSLLTLLFSGVCTAIKLLNREKFRLNL